MDDALDSREFCALKKRAGIFYGLLERFISVRKSNPIRVVENLRAFEAALKRGAVID